MEQKDKKNKRIRYPKKKETKEEKKHFVLDVHDVTTSSKSKIGN